MPTKKRKKAKPTTKALMESLAKSQNLQARVNRSFVETFHEMTKTLADMSARIQVLERQRYYGGAES